MNDYKELCERPELCWAYIDELRAAIAQLAKYVKKCEVECEAAERCINQLVRERNAAVADLKFLCKNYNVLNICITCGHCADRGVGCNKETCEYEWRGAQNADS